MIATHIKIVRSDLLCTRTINFLFGQCISLRECFSDGKIKGFEVRIVGKYYLLVLASSDSNIGLGVVEDQMKSW